MNSYGDDETIKVLNVDDDVSPEEFNAAMANLQELASKIPLPQDKETRVTLEDLNFSVLKALVQSVISNTEEQIEELMVEEEKSAYELANIIRPRLELIYNLLRKKGRLERLYGANKNSNNPDLQRCFYNIDNTLNYMSSSLQPYIEQFNKMKQENPEQYWLAEKMEKANMNNKKMGGGARKRKRHIGF